MPDSMPDPSEVVFDLLADSLPSGFGFVLPFERHEGEICSHCDGAGGRISENRDPRTEELCPRCDGTGIEP